MSQMKTFCNKKKYIINTFSIKMEEIVQTINTTTTMVVAISEKRCDCYTHPCKYEYKVRPKGPIYNKYDGENQKIQKHKPII